MDSTGLLVNQQLLSLMHFGPRAKLSEQNDPDHHRPHTNHPGEQKEKGVGGTRASSSLLHKAEAPGMLAGGCKGSTGSSPATSPEQSHLDPAAPRHWVCSKERGTAHSTANRAPAHVEMPSSLPGLDGVVGCCEDPPCAGEGSPAHTPLVWLPGMLMSQDKAPGWGPAPPTMHVTP